MQTPYLGLLDELLPRKIYPQFRIDHDMVHSLPALREFLAQTVLDPRDRDDHTAQYPAVKKKLLDSWTERHGGEHHQRAFERDASNRIPLNFFVAMNGLDAVYASAMLTGIADVMALAQDPTRRELLQLHDGVSVPGPRFGSCFHLQCLDVFLMQSDHLLNQIAQCGIPITMLSLVRAPTTDHSGALTPIAVAHFVLTLLLHQPTKRMPTSVNLVGNSVDLAVLAAFSSAIAINQSIDVISYGPPHRYRHFEEVEARLFERDLTLYWKWVAYSVFSAAATTNTIRHVDLHVHTLNATHVEAMKQVIDARNPSAAMVPYPHEDWLGADPVQVDVKPYAQLILLHGEREDERPAVLTTGSQVESLLVADDLSKRHHVSVVYPGAGLCWLHRDDIVARRVVLGSTAIQSQSDRPLLERLALHLNERTPLDDALLPLIQLLGPRTRFLSLKGTDDVVLEDAFFGQVLAFCPNLERLDLVDISVASFSWLVDNKNSQQQLKRLGLIEVPCHDPEGYERLLSALASQESNPISKTLEELCLQREPEDLEPLWSRIWTMLDTNTHLHRLVVACDLEDPEGVPDPLIVAQLAQHHGDLLHVRKAPLALTCKLAFLSALAKDPTRQYAALDAAVVSIIFAFAAPNKRRRATVF